VARTCRRPQQVDRVVAADDGGGGQLTRPGNGRRGRRGGLGRPSVVMVETLLVVVSTDVRR